MSETQEIHLNQDQVAPHFLSVMSLIDGYINSVRLPGRPADKMLRADYESNLSLVFATELARQVDSHTQAEAPQFVRDFSEHFSWGVSYALEHRDLTRGADLEDPKNFLAQFTHVNNDQKAAMLAGYAGMRFSQGFTGPGRQALEKMASLYTLNNAEVIGREYVGFFTSSMRRLQKTEKEVFAMEHAKYTKWQKPWVQGKDYPAMPYNGFQTLREVLQKEYGIEWVADADGGKGAFVPPGERMAAEAKGDASLPVSSPVD